VVTSARTIEPSEEPDVLSVAGDIAEPDTRIDTLVNNAGLFITSRAPTTPPTTTRRSSGSTSPDSSG
jgi:hypothetical protein